MGVTWGGDDSEEVTAPRRRVPPISAERLSVEMKLQLVRVRVLEVLEAERALLLAARREHGMSYDLIAHRVGVRRHELVVAVLERPTW